MKTEDLIRSALDMNVTDGEVAKLYAQAYGQEPSVDWRKINEVIVHHRGLSALWWIKGAAHNIVMTKTVETLVKNPKKEVLLPKMKDKPDPGSSKRTIGTVGDDFVFRYPFDAAVERVMLESAAGWDSKLGAWTIHQGSPNAGGLVSKLKEMGFDEQM